MTAVVSHDAAEGSPPDQIGFGATLGGTFALVALLVARVHRRAVLLAIAALQVLVIVGYVAFAGLREPAVETWGLLIKACQAVVLGATAYVILAGSGRLARETR